MAFQFDLVSPERRLASFEASEVQIPAAEGDMTAMADHAPTITTLRPGVLRAVGKEGAQDFAVTGGFAEITAGGASVLAERAMPISEAKDAVETLITEAREAARAAEGDAKDAADKLVADYEALKAAIG
ncbi:MAG: F0F1 ATP synthase subunit epsilon [Pseudomonadota bacterium]